MPERKEGRLIDGLSDESSAVQPEPEEGRQ